MDNNFKIAHRGFLFIDLQASMEQVDRLGLIPYSQFITYCFELLEELRVDFPLIETHQYAGDGVIFTWEAPNTTGQAIRFFQEYLNMLEQHRGFLEKTFNIFPYFSAAINLGDVVINHLNGFRVFYGNVINSTARLQGLCKHYDQQLILSEAVHLACPELKLDYLNRVYLKGLSTAMEIYGLPNAN
ncbi:adenylate/guanylate cyclase domain-containing protein [Aureispira anguillae]|uniref:Guanylate cyclase domain-containing protein n=1 Tax=Aureispira anguillae TaxID=2864201 RepID=A0A916DT03_9BACT|nr:hypothetical protein [Aureispira anguillae]BDS12879.1 hypothetical protein AsAng_0036040 [Aureispira anguillae]